MTQLPIEQVKPGQIILPPERELRLWMRKYLKERQLSEQALYLTVREIYEGSSDKKGRWLIVKCDQSTEWDAGKNNRSFNFKARPATLWPVIA